MNRRIFTLFLLGYFMTFALAGAGVAVYWYNFERPPQQPIAFSHRTHLTKVGLECADCHKYADVGLVPTIPSVSRCMDCHTNVKVNSPEVIKLAGYWERQEPIPWLKVHGWPARKNVRFTHKRHIKADVPCETCHGEVEGMEQMRKVRSLKMGWCVSCHIQNVASTDCWTCHK